MPLNTLAEPTGLDRLRKIGFRSVGRWTLTGSKLVLSLSDVPRQRNALYAFLVHDQVLYVGKTTSTLPVRLRGYASPGPTQSTNLRNRANLLAVLERGGAVDIWAFPDEGLVRFGGFALNLPAALEDDIIATLRPPWNGGRKDALVTQPGRGDPPEEVVEVVDAAAGDASVPR